MVSLCLAAHSKIRRQDLCLIGWLVYRFSQSRSWLDSVVPDGETLPTRWRTAIKALVFSAARNLNGSFTPHRSTAASSAPVPCQHAYLVCSLLKHRRTMGGIGPRLRRGGLVQRVEKGRWRVTRGLCAGPEHRPCRPLGHTQRERPTPQSRPIPSRRARLRRLHRRSHRRALLPPASAPPPLEGDVTPTPLASPRTAAGRSPPTADRSEPTRMPSLASLSSSGSFRQASPATKSATVKPMPATTATPCQLPQPGPRSCRTPAPSPPPR